MKKVLSIRTKAKVLLVVALLIGIGVSSVMSVTRTITDSSDTVYTYITSSNGNYWVVDGVADDVQIQAAMDDLGGYGTVTVGSNATLASAISFAGALNINLDFVGNVVTIPSGVNFINMTASRDNTIRNAKVVFASTPYVGDVISLHTGTAGGGQWASRCYGNRFENIDIYNSDATEYNWTGIHLMVNSDSSFLDNTFSDFIMWNVGTGIELDCPNPSGWMNGNTFERIWMEGYNIMVDFDSEGATGSNGINYNFFTEVEGETCVYSEYGFRNISNAGNMFRECLVWDFPGVADNPIYNWWIGDTAYDTTIETPWFDEDYFFDEGISDNRVMHNGGNFYGRLYCDQLVFINSTGSCFIRDGTDGSNDLIGTDATIAIETAMSRLTSGRTWKERVLVKGDFTINSKIDIPSYTILEIVGKLTAKDALSTSMIENSDNSGGNTHIEICGGVIDGNKNNQASASDTKHTIDIDNVDYVYIHNLEVQNGWTAGIHIQYCNHVDIIRCLVNNSADDNIAINLHTYNATVTENTCMNAGNIGTSYGSPCGIEIQDGSHHVIVSNNIVIDADDDLIQVGAHDGVVVPHDVSILGNMLHNTTNAGSGAGIRIAGDTSAGSYTNFSYNILVTDNTITVENGTNDLDGIVVDYAKSVEISDNKIHGGNMGIMITGLSHDIKICDNFIENCTYISGEGWGIYTSSTASNGIFIEDNTIINCNDGIYIKSDNVRIIGNDIYDTRSGTDRTQDYGIIMLATSDSTFIFRNIIENNAQKDIANYGTNTLLFGNYANKYWDYDTGTAIAWDNYFTAQGSGTNYTLVAFSVPNTPVDGSGFFNTTTKEWCVYYNSKWWGTVLT